MSIWWALSLTLLLLLLNALFVASEFALISARRTQLEPLAQAGSRPAKLALRAMENVTLAMAAAQMGITICSLGLGAISEPAIAYFIEPAFEAIGVPDAFVHPVAFIIALTLVVFLHVVYGEMVPKNIALATPDKAAMVLGPFMLVMVAILKPIVVTLNGIANLAVRSVGVEPRDEVASTFSHEEVAGLVEESRNEGLLDDDEYGLVTGALDFHGGTVEQVLLPKAELVVIASDATPEQIEFLCAETGFSRFPVATADGNLTGYVHIKDVLETDERVRTAPVAEKWIRPLGTTQLTSGLYEALRAMQGRGSHMARVINGDGQVAGAVMLEDVLEELVGEIRDAEQAAGQR